MLLTGGFTGGVILAAGSELETTGCLFSCTAGGPAVSSLSARLFSASAAGAGNVTRQCRPFLTI